MTVQGAIQVPATPVPLPAPIRSGGRGLMDALAARKTTRAIRAQPLQTHVLSNLLWAAAGHNRPATAFKGAGRTTASAGNAQEIELYVLESGRAAVYEPLEHRLLRVADRDLRGLGLTGGQRGPEEFAPVQLLLVADVGKLSHHAREDAPGLNDPHVKSAYAHFDAGLVAQNIYLFAAANGLAAWLHNCDRAALRGALRLEPEMEPLFAVSIGYPAA